MCGLCKIVKGCGTWHLIETGAKFWCVPLVFEALLTAVFDIYIGSVSSTIIGGCNWILLKEYFWHYVIEWRLFDLFCSCGSGLSGEALTEAGHHWVGMDISRHMLGKLFRLLGFHTRSVIVLLFRLLPPHRCGQGKGGWRWRVSWWHGRRALL